MRRVAFALLLLACAWVFLRPSFARGDLQFDPLDARGREVERAIEEQRFADALPIATDLQSAHPADPVIAFWLAEIEDGLGRFAAAGDRWARVLDLTHEVDAACPAMPEAYAHAGLSSQALKAYERCAEAAPADVERWLDLARAYSAAGQTTDADRALAKARELDPTHPGVAAASTRAVAAQNEGLP